MATIKELTTANASVASELAALGSALHEDNRAISEAQLQSMTDDKNISIVVAEDEGHVIGMGTLYVIPKIGKVNAYIEDVIVSDTHRGQGLGEKIVRELVECARKKGVQSISLTSRIHRVAAHKLYEKIGFSIVETNVFKLKL